MRRTSFWFRALLLCACLSLTVFRPVAAQTPTNSAVEVTELWLERAEGALLLQSTLRLDLSSTVEDALQKGMPIYFVTEAELMRDRWYWYDKKIGAVTRHYRLAYQPLTRKSLASPLAPWVWPAVCRKHLRHCPRPCRPFGAR